MNNLKVLRGRKETMVSTDHIGALNISLARLVVERCGGAVILQLASSQAGGVGRID